MSKHFTALLEEAIGQAEDLETAAQEQQTTLRRLLSVHQSDLMAMPDDVMGSRLSDLAHITLPAYTVPKELDDVRAAYVLQSYVNLGHPASQEEAAKIARGAGYSSGRGANIFFTHGWLVSEPGEDGVVGRHITSDGSQWLESKGRTALLTWLGQ